MKGLELSKAYYREFGALMIHEKFPELEKKLAIGLIGSGSECFGFDDNVSLDHDFEPGFCIFLPPGIDIDEKTVFRLERAYAHLPAEFMGFKRSGLSPVGGNRHGVIKTEEFFAEFCGNGEGKLTAGEWLTLPEYMLAQCVNGEVFRDDSGFLHEIRGRLLYYPYNIRLKKMAGYLLLMAQSGAYNYGRSLKRGDTAAAQLSAYEFVKNALHLIFLINGKYMPYYKWSFKALSGLEKMSDLYMPLEFLISSDNENSNPGYKSGIIKDVSNLIVEEIFNVFPELNGIVEAFGERGTSAMGLSGVNPLTKRNEDEWEIPEGNGNPDPENPLAGINRDTDLEKLAYRINSCIDDGEIRNLHILAGV